MTIALAILFVAGSWRWTVFELRHAGDTSAKWGVLNCATGIPLAAIIIWRAIGC